MDLPKNYNIFIDSLFILSCIFKKTCKWKKCPFRSKNYGTMDVWNCTKCPYPFDAEEEEELERIDKLITQLAQKETTK